MQRTALVVDDSKSARFALRRHLEGHAFKVDTADSAEEAYRFVQSQRPDLIFLDHIMPGVDGFEALRQLKQDPATAAIPIVICSSNEGEAFVAEARDQGAADVLPKPPTPAHLQRVLASIEQQSSQQEIEASLAAAAAAPEALDDGSGLLDATPAEAPPGAAAAAAVPPQAAAQIAALEARVAALEARLEQEIAALRREADEAGRKAFEQLAQRLLQALQSG